MRLAFLGFGLIGGSIARAVRAAGFDDGIAAWTPSGRGPAGGLADGVIDVAARTPEGALADADLVILAAPAPDCLALLDDLAGPWRSALRDDAIITDVASSKTALVVRATALGCRFVGGHPMAGRETSGYAAADADLFRDRPWVVIPSADGAAVERVEARARAVGAHPIQMTAGAHDTAVAGVSHLPLLTAVALVEAVAGHSSDPRADWPIAAGLAASGWRDTTRLARGDPTMGAGIVTTNAGPLADRLRDVIDALGSWLVELERPGGPDRTLVTERLAAVRDRLEPPAI
jgi:prephenate dehydrogenase